MLVVVAAGLLEFLVICIVLDHLWNHEGYERRVEPRELGVKFWLGQEAILMLPTT